jgi:hypothetical protein
MIRVFINKRNKQMNNSIDDIDANSLGGKKRKLNGKEKERRKHRINCGYRNAVG